VTYRTTAGTAIDLNSVAGNTAARVQTPQVIPINMENFEEVWNQLTRDGMLSDGSGDAPDHREPPTGPFG